MNKANSQTRLSVAEMPKNVEGEYALLGAMMMDNQWIARAVERLTPDDFFEPFHGRVFKAMSKMHENGRMVTPITLKPIVEMDPALEGLGGLGYIVRATSDNGALLMASDMIDQIQILASRRKSMIAMADGIDALADTAEDIEDTLEIVDGIEDQIRLATAREHREKVRRLSDATESVRNRARQAESGVMIGAKCRTIPQIDEMLGPIERATLNIIGGRPGQAKTSSAVSMALGYAANGFATEFFHLEMKDEQLDLRVISDISEMIGQPITFEAIKKGRLGSDDFRVLERIEEMQDMLPIEFTALKTRTDIRKIESLIVRAKRKWERRKKKLWCVFIDYMQLIGATSNGKQLDDDLKRISTVCAALNEMKQKHDIAIFALAQLSRDVDRRPDKRPLMADLKGSGDLEQDADSITFCFRPEYYLEGAEPTKKDSTEWEEWNAEYQASRDKLDLICRKNRHGAPSTVTTRFIKEHYAVRSRTRRTELDEPILQRDMFDGAEMEMVENF
jgi:replicative DNA helicase